MSTDTSDRGDIERNAREARRVHRLVPLGLALFAAFAAVAFAQLWLGMAIVVIAVPLAIWAMFP